MLRRDVQKAPEYKSLREIGLMREAGKLVARALRLCREMAKPGVKTADVNQNVASFYGGTGLLIVISVALDLVQKINSHLVMRNYPGLTED